MMGRGRVDHAPSAPINIARTEGRREGGSAKKKKRRIGERGKRERRSGRRGKEKKPKERDRGVKEQEGERK